MPQMAPMLWTPLYFIFSMLLLFVMMKILFTNSSSLSQQKEGSENPSIYETPWKW